MADGYGRKSFEERKRKRAEPEGPSKVLVVRGIPNDTQENEVASLAGVFGGVVRILLVAAKHHAFVELDSVETATKVVEHYNQQPSAIRQIPVRFEYSNRQEVTPNPRYPSGQEPQVGGEPQSQSRDNSPPNTILLVSVTNMRAPVTIDNLVQVFRAFGEVLRVITFEKKVFQALIEYQNLSSAAAAKQHLEGKDLFHGCCTLHVSFSTLTPPLVVKANNERARDLTTLPPGGVPFFPQFPPQAFQGFPQQQPEEPSGGVGSVIIVHNLPEKVNPDILFTLFGVYGDVQRVKILYNKKDTALIQFTNPQQASTAQRYLDRVDLYGNELQITGSKHASIQLPPANSKFGDSSSFTKDFGGSKQHRFRIPQSRNERHIAPPSAALHLSNLPDNVTEDEINGVFISDEEKFTVTGIRIFGKDRKMAIVSLETPAAAVAALIRFHNYRLRDKFIRVTFSHARGSEDYTS